MLGAMAVGKTSLVRRFVEGMFSERYQATIGVKIDRKTVVSGNRQVNLVIWDLQGDDDIERVRASYLRGVSGLLIVADGTRPDTLQTASQIRADADRSVGRVPTLLLLNKCDLQDTWHVDDRGATPDWNGLHTLRTSARTGENVEEAFSALVGRILTA